MTVRDFTQIFDAYSQFEESIINKQMETANERGLNDEGKFFVLYKSRMLTHFMLFLI